MRMRYCQIYVNYSFNWTFCLRVYFFINFIIYLLFAFTYTDKNLGNHAI